MHFKQKNAILQLYQFFDSQYSQGFEKYDYYPFGMIMTGRKYAASSFKYRYGFNGKENDNEVKGEGNQQDYGMRIYDPRLGRFLSEDPIARDYPELSPYQFSSNSPISGIDVDGAEFQYYNIKYVAENGGTKLKVGDYIAEQDKTIRISSTVRVTTRRFIIPISADTKVNIDFTLGDIGISHTVIPVNGVWRVLPHGVDPNNLPALNDPLWEAAETPEQYTDRFVKNGNKLISLVSSASDLYNTKDLILKKNAAPGGQLGVQNKKIDDVKTRGGLIDKLKKGWRPERFRKGVVDDVWEKAKAKGGGKVIDPTTGKEIVWDGKKPRSWDMGHKPGKEWKDLKKQYENGEINKKQLLDEYNNADNYRPELPSPNRSNNSKN